MKTLRTQEMNYRNLAAVGGSIGIFLLAAGCSGFSKNEAFARCYPAEANAHQPVDLNAPIFAESTNIGLLKKSVQVSPQTLIDTARRIHPSAKNPDNSMLSDTVDRAHNEATWNSGGPDGSVSFLGDVDTVNNPGDILCETTPFGDPSSNERRVYYDQDGLNLLARVEAALDDTSQKNLFQ